MNPLFLWSLHKSYTINEAIFLILDYNPADFSGYGRNNYPDDYFIFDSLITKAIGSKELDVEVEYEQYGFNEPEINLYSSVVSIDELKRWLLSIGFRPAFFFPESGTVGAPDYLNENHLRYSDQLAACIKVWIALEDERLTSGKGVIPAITSYLTDNYKELGLIHKRDSEKNGYKKGDINKGAVDRIAKIVNWNDNGGAAKTPSIEPDSTHKARCFKQPPPISIEPTPPNNYVDSIDDIPF